MIDDLKFKFSHNIRPIATNIKKYGVAFPEVLYRP